MTEKEEKSCETCQHYVAYYAKEKGRFRKLTLGHCSNEQSFGEFRKTDRACEAYEQRNAEKEKQTDYKAVIGKLENLCKQIEELLPILE